MTDSRSLVLNIWWIGSLLLATSAALVIEIQPAIVTEETTGNVNITCRLDDNEVGAQTILTLKINKDQENPLVYMQTSGITYGANASDMEKFHAVGSIKQDVVKTFLKLSILQPGQSEHGIYVCKMAYLDKNGLLQVHQTSSTLTVEVIDTHKMLMSMRKEISDLRNQLNHHESKAAYSVAFSAALSSGYTLPASSVVVFDKVVTNIGDGYDPKTGVFTVPRDGLYILHLVMRSNIDKGDCYNSDCIVYVDLMADDMKLAQAVIEHPSDAGDDLDSQSSVNSVVELKQGVKIKAKTEHKMNWHGYMSCLFSGFLIKTL